MEIPKELVAASATPMLLSILAQGENYGYAIIQRVRELSGGELEWSDGMLYPILHRLEQQGLIESEWRTSEQGRRRKYYRLRREGSLALAQERHKWQVVNGVLRRLWEEPACLISAQHWASGVPA